jgi:hypothetical protein
VNQVKLSGFLTSDVTLRTVGSRGQMAVASLQFARGSDPVFLIACDSRVRQIVDFRKGDPIAITGRIALYPGTQRFVILLDIAGPWKPATDRAGFDYDPTRADRTLREIQTPGQQDEAEFFNATKIHAKMARVPGR